MPFGALLQGSDGYFYGTTSSGGTYERGTVFKLSTNGSLATLYSFFGSFTNAGDEAPDGASPFFALVQGSDGYLYGTTYGGGTNGVEFGGYGTVFKISTNGALTNLYSFSGGNDGATPNGLVQGSDGNFYGTTYSATVLNGGNGTVFKIGTNGVLTNLHTFTGGNDGRYPCGLVQGSDGNFYGTTLGGTNSSNGNVFKISPDGALTGLYSFTGGNDGRDAGGLVQGSDGSFYGTTGGGQGGAGTVFRLTIVPEFQAVTLTNNTLNLTWSTERGGVYQLQGNSDLSSTNWTYLGSPFTATGATLSTTDVITNGPQRFYRLVLSQ
jgi:uncharacterized repeat protein (TIGR03803 family)